MALLFIGPVVQIAYLLLTPRVELRGVGSDLDMQSALTTRRSRRRSWEADYS